MASNPEVSKLIAELSSILEQNRQKRNVMDSMLAGLKQGREMAQADQAPPKPAGSAESSYGNDKGASPFSYRNSPSPSAKALSPSTTREGRLGLASKYAETQGRERELLSKNPYSPPAAGSEFDETGYRRHTNRMPEMGRLHEEPSAREMELLGTNPYTSTFSNPTNDAVAEELRKREMQRSGAGTPLGGAGQPPPSSAGLDPAVVGAVSRSGGPVAPMGNPMVNTGGPQQPSGNLPPPGWSDKDYALLQALSQRAPGG